jgi:hypothetical protein
MKLKKLIMFVWGLFILVAVSYAAPRPPEKIPNPTFEQYVNSPCMLCGFEGGKPEDTLPSIENPDIKYPIGDYAGRDMLFLDLLKFALTSKDPYEKARNTAFVGKCAKLFTKRSVLNCVTEQFYTPLDLAAFYEHESLVNYFVKTLGFPIEYENYKGGNRTSLMIVAAKAKEKMTKQLIGLGANPDYRDVFLKSAADYAKEGMEEATSATLKQTYKRIYDYLVSRMTADAGEIKELIQNAVRRAVKYAFTEEQIRKTIKKISDDDIFRDGLILLDINGYKTNIT